EPQLEVSDYAAVVYDPNAGYADPIATAHGFAAAAAVEGAKIFAGHTVAALATRTGRVTGIKLRGGKSLACERVVVAAGNWTPRGAVPTDGRRAAARGMVGGLRRHAGFLSDPRPFRSRRPVRRGRLQRPWIQAVSRSGPAPGRVRCDGTSAGGVGGVAGVAVRGRPTGPARCAVPPPGSTTPIVPTNLARRGRVAKHRTAEE